MGDPHVLSRFAAGDEDAVRTIYRTYGRLVFAIAYKVLGDRELAEDATQQAFLQAWRGGGQLRAVERARAVARHDRQASGDRRLSQGSPARA